jgi:hypothetical protein
VVWLSERLSATQRIIRSCSALSRPARIPLISSAAKKSDFWVIVDGEPCVVGAVGVPADVLIKLSVVGRNCSSMGESKGNMPQ